MGELFSEVREGPGLLWIENLRHPRYVRLVYGNGGLARQGARFVKVGEKALATAKTLKGLQAETPIGANR